MQKKIALLDNLINKAFENGASDVHIIPESCPFMRVDEKIASLSSKIISSEEIAGMVESLTDNDVIVFDSDFSYTTSNHIHARINVFKDRLGFNVAVRVLPKRIPSMGELLIPESVMSLVNLEHGLVLICGPTGAGKTTTLASMIDAINEKYNYRVITIEDPMEYVFTNKRSVISQREVGIDVMNFKTGLRSALREDPDVILVGEMRDKETIETAIHAAESGHLVFSTLHAANVVEAVDRVIQYFPADGQSRIAYQLANAFGGIIAQKLLPRINGGSVAAFEVMLRTVATVNLIRQGQMHLAEDYMTQLEGMQSMEDAINVLKIRHILKEENNHEQQLS